MKKLMRTFALMAVAALGLSACTGEKLVPDNGNADGKFVTVHFGAEAAIEGATKATLTPNEAETMFASAWENDDVISVKYLSPSNVEKIVPATWKGEYFEAVDLPNEHGEWYYQACYPKPDEKDSHIDFGGARIQDGNKYNSAYDVMVCELFSEANADAGKTADRKDVIFNMERKTGIAYFHLTGGPADEEVVSATLSVEGGFIASQHAKISDFAFDPTKDLTNITITYKEGTAPMASDFQLWYNVLPTNYTKMTLTVETANHTLTISRNAKAADNKYEAGKLYKVVKKIPADKWVSKAAYTGGDLVFDFKTHPAGWPAETNANAGDYDYVLSGVKYAFNLSTRVYCKGTSGDNGYLMISGKNDTEGNALLGLPAISGFKLTKVVATINDQVTNVSSKTMVAITDGVDVIAGGVAQNWNTKGAVHTYTLTETEENTVYYMLATVANAQVMKLVLSYEPATPSATKYAVSFVTVEGGSFSASPRKAEAGAEITLTATPAEGYAFDNDWSVKGADETEIEVVDGKFTMPAQNVTVSGTFSKVAYTITKAAVENGSFIVKKGDAEVTTAFIGDKLILEATPAEGFTFGKWTVTYMDGETEKSFNPSANTFTMPGANVTVSATFVEAATVPVYASVAELIAAGKPTKTATKVTVTLTDEEIIRFHTLKDGTVAGAIIKVGTQEVEIFCEGTPSDWIVGGTISGTLTNCDWQLYNSTWELCPADYSELTYKAPLPTCATPVITIAEGGVVSIACETAGATIHYTVGDSPADPTEADAVFSAVTLTDGQTIKAIAVAENYKPSAVASKKYTVGGTTGLVEYVSTFTDMKLNTKEKTMTWESSLEANSFESANLNRGVQFGAGKGKFTITGTGHTSNVKKISVIISTNATSGNTISATVGGVAIGKQISLNKANNYEIVFESTTELSGDIVFSVNDASKSVYIKSITVNPSN